MQFDKVLIVFYQFFSQNLLQPIQGPSLLFSSVIIFPYTVGLLGRVISQPQNRYVNTGRHKHKINAVTSNIYAVSGIRTHDPSVRASEDSAYF
jgi:hypothetical protein